MGRGIRSPGNVLRPPGAGGGRAVKAILRRCRSGPFFPQALVGACSPQAQG